MMGQGSEMERGKCLREFAAELSTASNPANYPFLPDPYRDPRRYSVGRVECMHVGEA